MESFDFSQNTSLKPNQSHLHRVDIGEGLSLFEKPKSDLETSDEIIVPDLTRYTQFHHPRQGKINQYNWNHESPLVENKIETWSNKYWQSSMTPKIPNKMHNVLKNSETLKKEKENLQSQPKGYFL